MAQQDVTNAELRADIQHLSSQLTDLEILVTDQSRQNRTTFDKQGAKLEQINIRLSVAEEKIRDTSHTKISLAALIPQVEKNSKFINTLTWKLIGAVFLAAGLVVSLSKFIDL